MLDAAINAPDPWTALADLAAAPPGGARALAAEVAERYESASKVQRQRLEYLLALLRDDDVILDLLQRVGSAELLAMANRRGAVVASSVLDGLVERLGYVAPVVEALGLSGDPARIAELGELLGDAVVGDRAALALARLNARDWTVRIAQGLFDVTGNTHVAFTAALIEMGDTAAVPHLLRWLAEGPDLPAGDVHQALVRLTGRDPLIPEDGDFSAHVRRIWPRRDLSSPPNPEVRDLVVETSRRVRFALDDGLGRVRVGFGSEWPRWYRTLFVADTPLYRVSGFCGTCETTMGLLGFPDAPSRAADVRETLADLHELENLDALRPIVRELESGHYRAHLVDLPVERVDRPERSWWLRRIAVRDDPERWTTEDATWPGVAHFQVPALLADEPPTYGSVVPSQSLDGLDPSTVARHAEAIARGERPTALLLAWTEYRYVEAEAEERFLLGVVLDGHHRLAAYAAAGVPARVLILTRDPEVGELV